MSSSRSIAAARNRRSGESSLSAPMQTSRPNKSIGGQSAFIPQQQQQQQQHQMRRPGQQAQQIQPPIQPSQTPTAITKLSVSDAIGLVTLRLGRLEQFMYDVQAGAIETTGGEIPENSHVFDKSVITSIVNRLDSLEKREQGQQNNNAFVSQIAKLEKEIKDIKEILLTHIMKYEKFVIENDKKLLEIDTTLDDFQDKLVSMDEDQDQQQDQDQEQEQEKEKESNRSNENIVTLEETYSENGLDSNETNISISENHESSIDLKQHVKNLIRV